MKIDTGLIRYYGHGGGWLCSTPAITIGRDTGFLTITFYILFWSYTIQFSFDNEED